MKENKLYPHTQIQIHKHLHIKLLKLKLIKQTENTKTQNKK